MRLDVVHPRRMVGMRQRQHAYRTSRLFEGGRHVIGDLGSHYEAGEGVAMFARQRHLFGKGRDDLAQPLRGQPLHRDEAAWGSVDVSQYLPTA